MPLSEISRCKLCSSPVRIIRRADGAADHYEGLDPEEVDPPQIPQGLEDFLRASRRGKKTVAIVGGAWATRAWAPLQQKDLEVWCMNEMHGRPYTPAATRWFQLHPRSEFTKPHRFNHKEWLEQKHDFPIYMQMVYGGIPSAVRYPLREIQDKLCGKIIRGEDTVERLFGSTITYAFALALYEGFERIELFGIELVGSEEWAYQRESLAFWLGKADGMGVAVWMPQTCELLKMPLYAYEEIRRPDGAITVPPEYLHREGIAMPGVGEEFRDIHKGETAVAIGNGLSLNDIPREFLDRYPTFGVNHINLLPFQPTYHIVIDGNILGNLPERVYDAAAGAKIAFLGDQVAGMPIPGAQRLYALPNAFLLGERQFVFPGEKAWTGWTSIYVALKIAYHMGFKTILLVGVDHTLSHFSPDYPVSVRANSLGPVRLAGHSYHFALANEFYGANGRRIINLSAPSDLDEILERGDIKDWL